MTLPSRVAPSTGWPRAIGTAIALSLLLTLVLMVIPHWLLTALPFGSRGVRVVLATGWIAMATLTIIVVGRRLLAVAPHEVPSLSGRTTDSTEAP